MTIFVNRTLNLKKIKAIGFDMDHTVVQYNTEAFEELTYRSVINKLVEVKNYPPKLRELKFDFDRAIQGLVIDKHNGNMLKLSLYSKVKAAYHGINPLPYSEQQKLYRGMEVDLNNPQFQSLDTSFSLSHGILYSQLVDLKANGVPLDSFHVMADDIKEVADLVHQDGTLKNEVRNNIEKYIVQNPQTVAILERLRRYDKKLMIITNSEYSYTKLLLNYTINPFLKDYDDWSKLFDIVIVDSRKPRFFQDRARLLRIEPKTELMSNVHGPIEHGIFQGGNAEQLEKDLGLDGDQILYIGDHIYGDVVSLKKTFGWRTALVIHPMEYELPAYEKGHETEKNIESLMEQKQKLETELNRYYSVHFDEKKDLPKEVEQIKGKIETLDQTISPLLRKYSEFFNPYWGPIMRAGQEESRFAGQVEKYACIYMCHLADLLPYSPRTYFRPYKRTLPHEHEIIKAHST